jgi:GNAT superfamily N-acetyltransferase
MVFIRNAEVCDIDAMIGLLETLFAIETDFSFDSGRQRRGLSRMIGGCMKHKTIKVAETQGRVVGMASAQTVISTAEGGLAALVEDVVVDADFRGRGIGRRLVESLHGWAENLGVTRFQALVDTENRPALAFYRKNGWQPTRLACMRRLIGS